MEQYLVTRYTVNDNLYVTNLITDYNVKELYSVSTLHLHCSTYYNANGYIQINNIHFFKLKKIKAKAVLYGNCYAMFYESEFNGVLSNWVTSSVTDMGGMFCRSKFNGDISNWVTSSVTDMNNMFRESQFVGDISNWVTSSVSYMWGMFYKSNFNGVISNWDVSSVTNMDCMFYKCPAKIPIWYKSNK